MSALDRIKQSVKANEEQQQKRREGMSDRFMPWLTLKSGESHSGYFVGDGELLVGHSLKLRDQFGKDKFAFEICPNVWENTSDGLELAEDHQCVFCHQQPHDNRISKPKEMAYWSWASNKPIHKDAIEKKSQKGTIYKVNADCTAHLRGGCEYCSDGLESTPLGLMKYSCSMMWAGAILGMNERLQGRCVRCGGQKITHKGFLRDGKPVKISLVEGQPIPPDVVEMVECKKCGDTERADMFSTAVTITRTGSGTSTVYTFVEEQPFEVPDWVRDITPIDYKKTEQPLSAQKSAELLGIVNPFSARTGRGGVTPGKAEADWEPEEEESVPVKPFTPFKQAKRPKGVFYEEQDGSVNMRFPRLVWW